MFYTKWNCQKLYEEDKDFSSIDNFPHELLDMCKYPSIEEQVRLFLTAGQKLDVCAFDEEPGIDDADCEDIDEFSIATDSPDSDIHDFQVAIRKSKGKKKKEDNVKEFKTTDDVSQKKEEVVKTDEK